MFYPMSERGREAHATAGQEAGATFPKGTFSYGEGTSLMRPAHLHRLDADFGDAAAFHFNDGEATPFKVDAFAAPGDVAQAHQQKAGEGLDAAFPGQAPLHLGFQVAEVDAAVHEKRATGRG